jgi:TRAP-type C4-dicarboxylate transport system substrate-binding protein
MTGQQTIRIGGYAPRDSTHSRAVEQICGAIEGSGLGVKTEVLWNIMDDGRPAGDLLDLVESGDLDLCYFSTSYLCKRVPALAALDLPYQFASLEAAHSALDGDLGQLLTSLTEAATGYRVLGYWDNGFRHVTNRLHPIRTPDDLSGMRIRLQPSSIHERMAELWGAIPAPTDLADGIAMLIAGQLDAQENPFANIFAYGIATVHPYVTMTGHVYGARGIYANRAAADAWPTDLDGVVRDAVRQAIISQRIDAAEVEASYRKTWEKNGGEVVDLTDAERAEFVARVQPLRDDLRREFGSDLVPEDV